MSRAALAVQSFSVNGGAITFTAPNGNGTGNGNTIATTDKRTVLLINSQNTTLTPTVTVMGVSAVYDGLTQDSISFTIPTQGIYAIWLIPDLFASGGVIAVDITTADGITWAAVSLPGSYQ